MGVAAVNRQEKVRSLWGWEGFSDAKALGVGLRAVLHELTCLCSGLESVLSFSRRFVPLGGGSEGWLIGVRLVPSPARGPPQEKEAFETLGEKIQVANTQQATALLASFKESLEVRDAGWLLLL